MSIKPLGAEQLRRATDPSRLPFETTAGIAEPVGPVGQDRAMRALHFGAGMAQPGYNIFVTGPSGTGRRTTVSHALRRLTAAMPAAPDVVYVHNFALPNRPRALLFEPGAGSVFKKAIQDFSDSLRHVLPVLLESDEYLRRRAQLEDDFHQTSERRFDLMRREAESQGLALVERGDRDFDFKPSRDGLLVADSDYRSLPKEERDRLAEKGRELRSSLDRTLEDLEGCRRATLERVRLLEQELAKSQIKSLTERLATSYVHHPEASAQIEAIACDAVAQIELLQAMAHGELDDRTRRDDRTFHRYEVNLLVDNAGAAGAPIVTLALPSVASLIGKVEHVPVLMTVVTDFMFIRPGALHRANGGFLLMDAMDLFRQELSWESLKRALKSRHVKVESVADILDRSPTVTIQPEPVPLDVKVVLFGEPWVYRRLCQTDPEFADLFKVQADFSTTAPRSDENCSGLICTMASIARTEGLKDLDAAGAARLLDEASRQAGDAEKISVRLGVLADMMREGDHYAAVDGRTLISARDIDKAVAARDDRSGRFKALEHELVERRILFIDTDGTKTGQLNGLTVLSVPGFAFGMPARITARVSPGEGRIVDIERVANFSGPSHAKGVQILSGYLNGTYAIGRPLSISASVAFEQSHGIIDGDSASAAELIAILSATAAIPLKQGIALTGSINQHGDMQPIGGANEKIEGFYDICASRGLARHHGVIIPRANVVTLMLRQDVVAAVREGRFAVYAADTVDDAIEVLTGMKAGTRRRDGTFPRGSFNRRVQERLIDFARPRLLKPIHLDGWWRF